MADITEKHTTEISMEFVPSLQVGADGAGVVLLVKAQDFIDFADSIRIEGWEDCAIAIGHGKRPSGELFGIISCRYTEPVSTPPSPGETHESGVDNG